MKAKDRIVKTTEENCHNTLEERLAEQDRISFKAGIKRAVVWIMTHNRFITDGIEYYPISVEDLQAKLEEWRIEND